MSTETVTYPVTIGRVCLWCGRPLVLKLGGRERHTCADACRKALSRHRLAESRYGGEVAVIVTMVLDALDGREPEVPPPAWGLVKSMVRTWRVKRWLREQERLLPGGAR